MLPSRKGQKTKFLARKFAIPISRTYLAAMKFEFCLPTRATTVPAAPEWFHEIKYDGYRLRLERDGARVRLITKGGYDWTKRYPWIVEAALKIRPLKAQGHLLKVEPLESR